MILPSKSEPYEHDSPVIGYVSVELISELSANPSLVPREYFMITQTDGVPTADVSFEYDGEDNQHIWSDDIRLSELALDPEEVVLYLVSRQLVELNRHFTLDDFEAFHILSESLGDS